MFSDDYIQISKDWIKAIYDLKKSLDKWAEANLQQIWDNNFQSGYMQFLLLIDNEGKTNATLSREAGVSKQAMSKLVAHLTKLGYIQVVGSENDKRSNIICLTPAGKKVVHESLHCFTELISSYRDSLSLSNIEVATDTLLLAKKFIAQNNK